MPYPSGPDKYGQTLIPETIGYIDPAHGHTVNAQLQRARQLQIVRDSWAVGFYHPANIPLAHLKSLVSGLRAQGYTFADLRALPTEVRSDYQPGPLRRLTTWITVDLILGLQHVDLRLEQKFAWWSVVRAVPWTLLLIGSLAGVFFIRLRHQWRPTRTAQFSRVESGRNPDPRRRISRAGWLAATVAGGLVLASGTWLLGSGSAVPDETSEDSLRGWSDLDWTVKYDGYGKVGAEGGVASMRPRAAQRPSETSAALALAGEPTWRNYSFTVKMRLREQLRLNSPPNEWEAGWLFFHYQDDDRSYYLAHKTNGLEFGKLVRRPVRVKFSWRHGHILPLRQVAGTTIALNCVGRRYESTWTAGFGSPTRIQSLSRAGAWVYTRKTPTLNSSSPQLPESRKNSDPTLLGTIDDGIGRGEGNWQSWQAVVEGPVCD